MASVTAEVLLYFGVGSDNLKFVQAVDTLRFIHEIDDSNVIIEILSPAFWLGHEAGLEDAEDL